MRRALLPTNWSRSAASFALLAGALPSQACSFPDYRITQAAGGSAESSAGSVESGGSSGDANGLPDAGDSSGSGGEAGAAVEMGPLDGSYRLVSVSGSKCLDADGPISPAGNVLIQQYGCDSTRTQTITMRANGDGYYAFAIEGSGDCVTVEDGSTADKGLITRAPCDESVSQQWLPIRKTDGTYLLLSHVSEKCLEVPGFKAQDIPLQQYDCNTGANQRWALASLEPQALPLVLDEWFNLASSNKGGAAPLSFGSTPASDPVCVGLRAAGVSGDCHVLSTDTFPAGATFASASWLRPNGNWGSLPGLLVAAGAQHIRFQARGSNGGEKVTFQTGGITGAFSDTFSVISKEIVLSNTWQSFSLDLKTAAYDSGIVNAFSCTADVSHNVAPLMFYVDDLVIE